MKEKDIKEFQKIYKKNFGLELGRKKARKEGERVLNLIKAICKPIKNK